MYICNNLAIYCMRHRYICADLYGLMVHVCEQICMCAYIHTHHIHTHHIYTTHTCTPHTRPHHTHTTRTPDTPSTHTHTHTPHTHTTKETRGRQIKRKDRLRQSERPCHPSCSAFKALCKIFSVDLSCSGTKQTIIFYSKPNSGVEEIQPFSYV